MKHRRFLIPAAIALTAALLLTACGQPAGNTNPSPARTHTVATPPPDDPESLPEDSSSSGSNGAGIDYRVVYQGFTAVALDDAETRAAFDSIGCGVITGDSEWQDFMSRYCPGIWYNEFSFPDDTLVFSVQGVARPAFNSGGAVESVGFDNGAPYIEKSDTDEIYALNTADTTHFFVTVVAVDSADVPENVQNVYGASAD